jgi:hypothetical protein
MQGTSRFYVALHCTIIAALQAGCVSAVSTDAICAGTEAARTEHAAALAHDGGDLSVITGAHLIRLVDAGCGYDT